MQLIGEKTMNEPILKVWKTSSLPPNWAERGQILNKKTALPLERNVKAIMEQVRKQGDSALIIGRASCRERV
jgi:hypothetical protein